MAPAQNASGTATPSPGKLRLAHGPVSTVRAIPSREVSVISVEIPDEHHVQATTLMHGRHALILRSTFDRNCPYGVLDVDLDAVAASAGTTPEDPLNYAIAHDGLTCARPTILHARVALVRPIPSRMVTAIYLEVPDAQHVEVTNLLHGRDAILFPVTLPPQAPLGILKLDSTLPQARRQDARAPASPMLGRRASPFVVTRWLGVQCASENFQDFLKVRTEAAARNKVCELCGVASRADIQGDAQAMRAFQTRVYAPFDNYRRLHAPGDGGARPRREAPSA